MTLLSLHSICLTLIEPSSKGALIYAIREASINDADRQNCALTNVHYAIATVRILQARGATTDPWLQPGIAFELQHWHTTWKVFNAIVPL